MPDSSGAAKENWGEKSVSDENERIPEVGPKLTNPRQEDKKARGSQYVAQVVENGNFGHTCFNTQNTPWLWP